jgi:hypothetical protein
LNKEYKGSMNPTPNIVTSETFPKTSYFSLQPRYFTCLIQHWNLFASSFIPSKPSRHQHRFSIIISHQLSAQFLRNIFPQPSNQKSFFICKQNYAIPEIRLSSLFTSIYTTSRYEICNLCSRMNCEPAAAARLLQASNKKD